MKDLTSIQLDNDAAVARELRQQALPYVRGKLAGLEAALAAVSDPHDRQSVTRLLNRARAEYREAHGTQP